MKHYYLAATLTLGLGIGRLAFASDAAAEELLAYKKVAKVSAIGMCDNMHSSLVQYTGEGFDEVLEFAPVSNDHLRFYVVKKGGNAAYFLVTDGKETEKFSAMGFYTEITPVSANFSHYALNPSLGTDCQLAPITEKKGP